MRQVDRDHEISPATLFARSSLTTLCTKHSRCSGKRQTQATRQSCCCHESDLAWSRPCSGPQLLRRETNSLKAALLLLPEKPVLSICPHGREMQADLPVYALVIVVSIEELYLLEGL